MQTRRTLIATSLLAAAGLAGAQQPWPNRPIRFIVPYTAGGGGDTMARLLANHLSEALGQSIVIDNRPGANGVIGTTAVAKAAPDGYTFLLTGSDFTVVPLLMPGASYDVRDFAPVSTYVSGEAALVVNPSLPARTLEELIALAKARPGKLNYGSWGNGSAAHLGMEMLSQARDLKMQHVPYKGGPLAVADVMGGQIEMYLGAIPPLLPLISSGKLRALAVSGKARTSALPDVPTFAEAGLPEVDATFWISVLAPAGTPREIRERMSSEIAKVLQLPEVRSRMAAVGNQPYHTTPDQFAALIKADTARYANLIKARGIKADK